ncbi:GNAT family N-acetyltransferase [Photobacterium rosenbergii]|uniref:GNAT family N-acetyltransferase n=1 Tax=Photobacterium rosenbergii TaxID=294936 RepID=A0A2T3NL29_9GAMM|nr:GNAT family N-acetyltransferase [Photobacterium rosenbergii]
MGLKLITIRPQTSAFENEILDIQADNEQIAFSASPQAFLETRVDGVLPFVICLEHQVIGYFKLDTLLPLNQNYCPENSVGLCTLLIDKRVQGKGLGTKSVTEVIEYVKTHFKQYDYLYLTVNCKNLAAYHCYLKSGFEDTQKLYFGGPVGPQHIMRVSL